MKKNRSASDNPLTTMSEQEGEQIFSVLLTLLAPEGRCTRLARNVELRGHCVCVYGPSRSDPSDDLGWLAELARLPAKERPQKILVIDPSLLTADQVAQAKTKWPNHFRRKGRKRNLEANLEIWDAPQVKERILRLPPLALRYFPNQVAGGPARLARIKANRKSYDRELRKLHGKIQFIGMSVYKEEATAAVDIEAIYIPLRIVGEAADEAKPETPRTDPLQLLARGERHVLLGDPGSGKSTLLRFLALVGTHRPLQERYHTQSDERLPILVTLRHFADALKANPDLNMLDYLVETTTQDFGLRDLDREFFEYYLYAGQALLLFDGVDELPGLQFKQDIRERIARFLCNYPGNTTLVTSRIVGYDKEIRYEALGFSHHRVSRLTLDDIEWFVGSWYTVRIDSRAERKRNVEDLVRIVRDSSSHAIRDLAETPCC
jgi:energy-coupling factor transporter ATP-binding protein EcfA2